MNFTSPFYSLPSRNELKLWGFFNSLNYLSLLSSTNLNFHFRGLEKELLETLGKGLVELFTFMYATQLGVNLGCRTIFFSHFPFFSSTSCSGWYEEHMNEDQEDKHVKMCIYVRVIYYICGGRDHWHQFPSFLALFAMFCSSCSFFYLIFSSSVWW